jgi:hypothetical protein
MSISKSDPGVTLVEKIIEEAIKLPEEVKRCPIQ